MSGILLLVYLSRSLLMGEKDVGNEQEPSSSLPPATNGFDQSFMVDRVLSYARELEGKPYRGGGSHPDRGFDCSGFVRHVYFEAGGLKLPRSSRAMAKVGEIVDLSELRPGDLMFFTGSNANSKSIGHVAMVLAVAPNSIQMIHTSSTKGVIIQEFFNMPYYLARFRWARRPYKI